MEEKLSLQLREKMQVRVYQRLVEGKRERNVPFVGVVQKVRGSGPNKTITVKQILEGVEVEKIFPIALPTITKIEIVEEKPKVKRKAGGVRSKKVGSISKAKSISAGKARSASSGRARSASKSTKKKK